MHRVKVSTTLAWDGRLSKKAQDVCRMFGLTLERLRRSERHFECSFSMEPGDIVCIVGPSGSGKSTVLRGIRENFDDQMLIDVSEVRLRAAAGVIDNFSHALVPTMQLLGNFGLADSRTLTARVRTLSTSERWRVALARAVDMNFTIISADEFCSGLDRISACRLSESVRKLACAKRLCFVVATGNRDILASLWPDIIVECESGGNIDVTCRDTGREAA